MQIIIFLVIFFINGIGIFPAHINLLMWLLASLFFLPRLKFYISQIKRLPESIIVSAVFFLGAVVLSLINSIDLPNSFLYLWFYLFCGLVFLEGVLLTQKVKKITLWILLGLGIMFILYSQFLNTLLLTGNTLFLPQHGYQLIYAKFTNHNHLGDYLAVLLAMLLSLLVINKNRLILFIVYLPFLILSFSRTAYFSLIGSASYFVAYSKISKLNKWIIGLVCLWLLTISLGVAYEIRTIKGIELVNKTLSGFGLVEGKPLTGNRLYLFNQAIFLFSKNPLTGYGIGNYPEAARKELSSKKHYALTSHNIFLDFLVETGILGLFFFIILIVFLLKNSDKRSVYFLGALALLINFQADYTFRIFGMLLLFSLLIGISVGEKTNVRH